MGIDWGDLFQPDQPLLETVLRGSLTYLGIILILRVVLKRQAGSFGMGDMLLIVLIADASQNSMAGEYRSWTNGVVLVLTLVVWNYALDWASYHSKRVRKLLEPEPTTLIRDGRIRKENLRREQITEDELQAQLRIKGISEARQVREARLESEGDLSVIRADAPSPPADPAQPTAPSTPAEAEEAALRDFLAAARRLGDAIAAHEQVIERHKDHVKRAREAFSRHGVQPRAFLGERVTPPGPRGKSAPDTEPTTLDGEPTTEAPP